MPHTLKVTGMHCSHCREAVEEALKAVPGVYGASVDLESGRAEVDGDRQVTAETLIAAVEATGYRATAGE